MSIPEIKYCPGTLAEGYNTYSPVIIRKLFDGKKISHILPYASPEKDEKEAEKFLDNRKRISLSGVQEKLSLLIDKNNLRLTREHEQGTYILKPIPGDLMKAGQVPANEHLTMQIARQVYHIDTAQNALIFFKTGEPAYITKRFDVKKDGSKRAKEDFATLAGKSKDTGGANFKYDYSYEGIGRLIKQYVPSWRIEAEKFLRIILFNYLFSNGDAHLKNFALLETDAGDYVLSPAYDLVNTRLHVHDTDFALSLFEDESKKSVYWSRTGNPSLKDFINFGTVIGIREDRVMKIIKPFQEKQALTATLIHRSFLNASGKKAYLISYNHKIKLLK